MEYLDDKLPTVEVVEKMNTEYKLNNISSMGAQVEVCELTEYQQKAEVEEIYQMLQMCEAFFKWLESQDDFEGLRNLLDKTKQDKIQTLGCCGRYGLDYRYVCDKDFHHDNCADYCKCEMEIIDRVIKLLSLKNSIVDKQCMMKLLQSRMEALRLIFGRYCRK